MATIKEIAKRANCSIGTVSRVLNFDESLRVSEEKKELILKIAEEMQYSAKKSQTRKSRYKIGLVSMYSTLEELDDPFYLSIRLGVEKKLSELSLDAKILHDTDEGYDYAKMSDVDGIVAIGHFTKTEIRTFAAITENIVFVNSDPDFTRFDTVLFDGKHAVKEVVNHLYGLGHREIGFIGVRALREKKGIDLAEDRYALVEKYLRQKGIHDPKYIYRGGSTYKDGYHTMKRIIDEDDLPTAFFIGNDSMCIGALTALYEAGIRVPSHMSVVGYNDITNAEYAQPPLTTVKVHTELMGAKGLELLIDRLKGRDIPIKIYTPTRLVKRKSTGKRNGKTI